MQTPSPSASDIAYARVSGSLLMRLTFVENDGVRDNFPLDNYKILRSVGASSGSKASSSISPAHH
jgi:hypothetical protein